MGSEMCIRDSAYTNQEIEKEFKMEKFRHGLVIERIELGRITSLDLILNLPGIYFPLLLLFKLPFCTYSRLI